MRCHSCQCVRVHIFLVCKRGKRASTTNGRFDVTYVYDDVTYAYDDVTYGYDDVTVPRTDGCGCHPDKVRGLAACSILFFFWRHRKDGLKQSKEGCQQKQVRAYACRGAGASSHAGIAIVRACVCACVCVCVCHIACSDAGKRASRAHAMPTS